MSKEKAIGYAYDSMGKQSSLDNQKKAIEEYCKEQGIELQSVHESSKQPGKDKSENFKEFLENQDVEDVTVVVSQIDRLASDFDSFDEITDLLKAKKATVISTQEGENKYYEEVLANKGVPVKYHSQVPFGYERVDGELVPKAGDSDIVAWVFAKDEEYYQNPPEILMEYVKEVLEDKYGEKSKKVTKKLILEEARLMRKTYMSIEINTRLGAYRKYGRHTEPSKVKEMLELPLTEDDKIIIKAKLRHELATEKKPNKNNAVIYARVGRRE